MAWRRAIVGVQAHLGRVDRLEVDRLAAESDGRCNRDDPQSARRAVGPAVAAGIDGHPGERPMGRRDEPIERGPLTQRHANLPTAIHTRLLAALDDFQRRRAILRLNA